MNACRLGKYSWTGKIQSLIFALSVHPDLDWLSDTDLRPLLATQSTLSTLQEECKSLVVPNLCEDVGPGLREL